MSEGENIIITVYRSDQKAVFWKGLEEVTEVEAKMCTEEKEWISNK